MYSTTPLILCVSPPETFLACFENTVIKYNMSKVTGHSGLPGKNLVYICCKSMNTVNYFNNSFHSQNWSALDNKLHGHPWSEIFGGSSEEGNGNNWRHRKIFYEEMTKGVGFIYLLQKKGKVREITLFKECM